MHVRTVLLLYEVMLWVSPGYSSDHSSGAQAISPGKYTKEGPQFPAEALGTHRITIVSQDPLSSLQRPEGQVKDKTHLNLRPHHCLLGFPLTN